MIHIFFIVNNSHEKLMKIENRVHDLSIMFVFPVNGFTFLNTFIGINLVIFHISLSTNSLKGLNINNNL